MKNIVKNFLITQKYVADEHKTTLKIVTQRTAEATGDLIANKIADKITKVSKGSPQNNCETIERQIDIPRDRYISPEKRQQRLII